MGCARADYERANPLLDAEKVAAHCAMAVERQQAADEKTHPLYDLGTDAVVVGGIGMAVQVRRWTSIQSPRSRPCGPSMLRAAPRKGMRAIA